MTTSSPKLLCVSLNPAIDRRIVVPELHVGEVNRALSADPQAGGKAAHVAFAAAALGAEVRWLAFLGGVEGETCRQGIAARGVTPVVVETAGRTRNTLELIDRATGVITEVLEPGPEISESERRSFLEVFAREVQTQPMVVLSGSLPRGMEAGFYGELVRLAKQSGARVLLDTSGEPLARAIAAGPAAIKPNRQEVSALLGREIQTLDEAVRAARELCTRGPETVILSLGGEGAVVATATEVLHATPPKVEVISTVGSGDSFLAGWAVGAARGESSKACLRLAIACGTANCMAQSPGIISRERVNTLENDVKIAILSA